MILLFIAEKQNIKVVVILLILVTGCATYDASLSFSDIKQPMQFGNFKSNTLIDTLGISSGILEIEEEEDTYAENENTTISMSGGEYLTNTIDSTMVRALNYNPTNFIGNSSVKLEIRHGIKVGALIFGFIASEITNTEANIGSYTIKKFTQSGIIYETNTNKSDREN